MPKSRGRRPRKARTHTPRRGPNGSRGWSEQDARLFSVMKAADDAESRGDAEAALDLLARHPWDADGKLCWRPERVIRLGQITMLGPLLPGWATSRWILAQAVVVLDEASRGRYSRAMTIAMRTRCGSPWFRKLTREDQQIKLMDHDWVYRQLVLYELGGLEHFVTRVASPDLLAGADHIREWMSTPMGGFRFVGSSYQHLTWERLGTREQMATINIGSATLLEPGDFVIGRPVPIEEGTMWESAPLYVPQEVAVRVSEEPGSWIEVLEDAARSAAAPGFTTHRQEFALLSDVPDFVRFEVARTAIDHSPCPAPGGARRPSDEIRDNARLMVLTAIKGDLDDLEKDDALASPWPSVAASLLVPGVLSLVVESLSPGDAASLSALAGRLAGPAHDLCHVLAWDLRESA